MSSDLLSIEQKKQAIGRGLSPYMDSTLLEKVLSYWELEYGNKPSFVLNRFLSEVCNTDELKFYRKDILKKVLTEIASLEKDVLEIPHKKMRAHDFPIEKSYFDAFVQFVQGVFQQINVADLDDFNDEVKAAFNEVGIEIDLHTGVDSRSFLNSLDPAYFSKVITLIYEAYCNFYGPSKADQLYAYLKNKIKMDYPMVDLKQLL